VNVVVPPGINGGRVGDDAQGPSLHRLETTRRAALLAAAEGDDAVFEGRTAQAEERGGAVGNGGIAVTTRTSAPPTWRRYHALLDE